MAQKRKRRFTRPTLDEMSKFKKLLGPLAKDYSEGQLVQLRTEMYEMAKLLLDIDEDRRKSGFS